MRNYLSILFLAIFSNISSAQQTKFGVMIFGKTSIIQKIQIAKDLGVDYVRDGVIMEKWTGSAIRYEKYSSAGLKVLLDINWASSLPVDGTKSGVPFPTDTILFKEKLSDILDKYFPEVAVIENEELTRVFHKGPIENYINELAAATNVCHQKGIKVTDGGLRTTELCFLVYKDYLDSGLKKQAEDFRNRTFNAQMKSAIDNPGANLLLDKVMKDGAELIKAFKKIPLDYVNIHYYEPLNRRSESDGIHVTANAIEEITNYVRRVTGKEVLSNEIGQFNTDPDLTKNILNEFAENHYAYAVWFSGDSEAKAKALHNDDGTLRPNGIAFKNFMAEYKKGK